MNLTLIPILFIVVILTNGSLGQVNFVDDDDDGDTCFVQKLETIHAIAQKLKASPNFYVDYCSVGVKDGRVADEDITASSVFNVHHGARNGRLDFKGHLWPVHVSDAWAAHHVRPGEWIQVDLKIPTYVTGVVTQGRGDMDRWITSYKIAYGNQLNSLQIILDKFGRELIFPGNNNRLTYVMNRFPQPITARYFRLIVVSYLNRPEGRLDYITC